MAEKEPVLSVEISDYDIIRRLWENRVLDARCKQVMVIEITIVDDTGHPQRYQASWPMVPDNYPTIENRLPPLPKDSCQD